MNKMDLIAKVAEKSGCTKKDATNVVGCVFDVITDALVDGEKIQLVGFGSFEVRVRGERMGRNPKTKEPAVIKAARVPVFKPGKVLKQIVDEGK